ncbi:hypothetical protein BU16DRAFT_611982 [Lophium mytilinum]|uniref:Uncharacterized protein n=1 Tax=Lophium mytilinum TaxID=390894 RepID=A0A6A6REY7_9PEZI|nr:hypothetical protein BU16DRAFT_611982 [Lophium mytilinum]
MNLPKAKRARFDSQRATANLHRDYSAETLENIRRLLGGQPEPHEDIIPFPFLKLPKDVRLEIYDFVFESRQSSDRNALALRLACRQIHSECTKIAFAKTTFVIKPIPRKRKRHPAELTKLAKRTRENLRPELLVDEYYITSLHTRLNTLPAHLVASLGRLRIVNGHATFSDAAGGTIAARLPNLAIVTFFTSHGGLLPPGFDMFMSHFSSRVNGSLVVKMTRPAMFHTTPTYVDQWLELIQHKHLAEGWQVKRDVEAELTGGTTLMIYSQWTKVCSKHPTNSGGKRTAHRIRLLS